MFKKVTNFLLRVRKEFDKARRSLGYVAIGVLGNMSFTEPLIRFANYNLNYNYPNALPLPEQIIELRHRKIIDEKTYYEWMQKQGFSKETATLLYENSKALIDVATIIEMKRRGIITEKQYKEYIKKYRYTEEDIKRIEKVTIFMPTVRDVISWAVREAFYDDYAKKYGLDEEYPEQLDEYGKKIGVDKKELRYFWRAHWELPSLSMGYEMLHRGIITREELESLFKAHDIMPYWRDKLVKLSYLVPTRVDIRRMLLYGVIDEEEAKRLYQALGYEPKHAEWLVEMAKKMYLDEPRTLTKAMICEAFRYKEIDREKAIELLQKIGYVKEDAELIIEIEEHKENDRIRRKKIDTIVDLFVNRIIDIDTFERYLDELGLPALQREHIIIEAIEERNRKLRLPSKADVFAWYKKGIINEAELKDYLRQMGYREKDVINYVKSLKTEK